MADIRIKDLTTTASSTASDDFFAADGTTNGTRKLSAYSPSFGGNATVGGTLTVSGTSSLLTVANSTGSALLAAFSSAYASGSATPYVVIGSFSDPATSGARIAVSTDYSLDNRAAIQLQTRTTAGTLQTALTLANTRNATFAADVVISGTTASTTTSSGALVVSGGVGVAGAIYGGGNLLVSGTGKIGAVTAADSRFHVYESSAVDVGNGVTIEQAGTGDAVTAFLLTGVQRWSVGIDNSDSDKFKIGTGALGSADRLTIDTSGNLAIPASTASTSTSSGALVVSGGVGVAKGLYVGEEITAANGTSTAPSIRFSSATTSGFSRVNTNSIGIVNNGIASGYLDGISGSGGLYIAASGTNQGITLAANGTGTVAISGAFQVGNAYTAGAPTATGYIVIKDSTGTSYKIPAQAL